MNSQTVYIVDDDDAVRDSVSALMDSVGLECCTFASGQEFLDNYSHQLSGCLVLDVRMAYMSGLTLRDKLKQMGSTLPIIFLTGYGDVAMAVEAMKSKAADFILKPYHEHKLLESINSALGQVVSEDGLRKKHHTYEKCYSLLTVREKEILALLTESIPNKIIGRKLGISYRTVEVHRQRILKKFTVSSLSELIRFIDDSHRASPVHLMFSAAQSH